MTLTAFQGCALDGCETPGQESYTGKTLDNQIVMRTSWGGGNDKDVKIYCCQHPGAIENVKIYCWQHPGAIKNVKIYCCQPQLFPDVGKGDRCCGNRRDSRLKTSSGSPQS